MTTQSDSVPKYFADFVQENARQHQELADRISGVETSLGNRIGGVEGELRIIKAVSIAILIALLGLLGTGLTGLVTYFLNL